MASRILTNYTKSTCSHKVSDITYYTVVRYYIDYTGLLAVTKTQAINH